MSDFEATFGDALECVPADHHDRTQFVPGVGPLDARVALVGEAPGEQEVEAGEPFVGPAGTRLDDALSAAGVDRGDVYVTNLVKVRPPANRTPHVAEIEAWWPVLAAELARVDPAVVVALGTTTTRSLLDVDQGITAVHGRRFERDGRVVVPVYHPAATLYDRSKRSDFEADIKAAFETA